MMKEMIHIEMKYFKNSDVLQDSLTRLTQREKECLRYLIIGKTADETAMILGISRRTVEQYRNNIRIKIGVEYSFFTLCYLLGKYNLISAS